MATVVVSGGQSRRRVVVAGLLIGGVLGSLVGLFVGYVLLFIGFDHSQVYLPPEVAGDVLEALGRISLMFGVVVGLIGGVVGTISGWLLTRRR